MKKFTKIIALLLALALCFGACLSLTACDLFGDKDDTPDTPDNPDTPETESYAPFSKTDAQIYEAALGEFEEIYAKAKDAATVSERFALMAIAEAKLMEAAVMVPLQSNGGNYAISKVAPYTISPCLWGNDQYRYHNAIVCTNPIKTADRNALKALYAEKKGTGEYEAACAEYLTTHGYTLKDSYNLSYTGDPDSYDAFQTSKAVNSELLVATFDGLLEYDGENVQRPALAAALPEVSDDGLIYTFKIREGAKWVNSAGEELGEVTADDWVAGFQHMLDDPDGNLEWLVEGVIVGVADYVGGDKDFAKVGVKATDKYTLVYTLEAPCSYFLSMFGYCLFAPLNRAFFESLGGKFGDEAANGTYGTDKDTIAYCGPYIVTTATANSTVVFEKNNAYWNADNIRINKITWLYNDGNPATKGYDYFKEGKVDGTGLNTAALEKAKANGDFEDYAYVSATDATSFPGFFNLNRTRYDNFNDGAVKYEQTDAEKTRAKYAMSNQNFRLALATGFDRGLYMEQSVGPELAFTSMQNSYTPGTFVFLEEETTVKINGVDKTYPAGTWYGQIMQDQIDADGYTIKVFDKDADNGIGSSAGYDGWYNPDAAKAFAHAAADDLAALGVTVDKDHPIHISYPFHDDGSVATAQANALKESIEASTDGLIKIDLVACATRSQLLYACYYFENATDGNYDISTTSGWGPDYGDPSSYLDTMVRGGGYMIKMLGLDV